jgi:quercetin dioxygenase-like cupin family protein
MTAIAPEAGELSPAWQEHEPRARWRSASVHGAGTGAAASASSLLEVPARCRLPRHTDSAEEAVVVIEGRARVTVGDDSAELAAGAIAVVPADVPHEVENTGDGVLRFAAVYAAPEVTITYEHDVEPDGGTERQSSA